MHYGIEWNGMRINPWVDPNFIALPLLGYYRTTESEVIDASEALS